MGSRMQVTHHFDGDVDTVYALVTDPDFCERKFAAQGATEISIDSEPKPDGGHHLEIRRRVTVDLPGFAKRVMQPTNTVVQTEEWRAPAGDGSRVCDYTVEVQGVPSRIAGTVTLAPDGAGTRQEVEADVKVSVPLVGGKLEKFAVDSGTKVLADEAEFTNAELRGRG